MTSKNIYFLIPNLIGYIRVLLIILAFYYCFDQHYLFVALYSISQLLDGLDGYAARYLQQTTSYGSVLDMVTDRASSTALLAASTRLYPQYTQLCMVLIALDIVSHFSRVYSALLQGKRSHKNIVAGQPWILRQYYNNKIVLSTLCLGNEAYLLLLYALKTKLPLCSLNAPVNTNMLFITIVSYFLGILFALKQFVNLVQLVKAAQDIVQVDRVEQKP